MGLSQTEKNACTFDFIFDGRVVYQVILKLSERTADPEEFTIVKRR